MNCLTYSEVRSLITVQNLKDNAIKLLTEEMNSVLGWEPSEVMSMEGTEVNLLNGTIYGVSYEVESEKSDLSHEAVS